MQWPHAERRAERAAQRMGSASALGRAVHLVKQEISWQAASTPDMHQQGTTHWLRGQMCWETCACAAKALSHEQGTFLFCHVRV